MILHATIAVGKAIRSLVASILRNKLNVGRMPMTMMQNRPFLKIKIGDEKANLISNVVIEERT